MPTMKAASYTHVLRQLLPSFGTTKCASSLVMISLVPAGIFPTRCDHVVVPMIPRSSFLTVCWSCFFVPTQATLGRSTAVSPPGRWSTSETPGVRLHSTVHALGATTRLSTFCFKSEKQTHRAKTPASQPTLAADRRGISRHEHPYRPSGWSREDACLLFCTVFTKYGDAHPYRSEGFYFGRHKR